MPGFITHYLCAQAVLPKISTEARLAAEQYRCLYNLGSQGPDIFFYYLPGLVRKRTRGVGVQIHSKNAGVFLRYMAERLNNARTAEEKNILFAYVAGFITHYALDAKAHPYVYARTLREKSSAIKNSVDHRKFETAIDVLMLKAVSASASEMLNGSKRPADYKLWRLIRAEKSQAQTTAAAVSHAVSAVYKRDIRAADVYKAMAYMIQLTRVLQSRTGRRKRWLEQIEGLTLGEHLVSSLIHPQTADDSTDYMNLSKTVWHAPWDKQNRKNDSFVDLYSSAVDDAAEMVELLYAYMRGSISQKRLLAGFGNKSLKTGVECV